MKKLWAAAAAGSTVLALGAGAWVYAATLTDAAGGHQVVAEASALDGSRTAWHPKGLGAGFGPNHRRGRGLLGPWRTTLVDDAATTLGMTTAALSTDLHDGKTLAAIAVQQGSTAAILETALDHDASALLAQAVRAGTITATQAAAVTPHLQAMVDAWVTGAWRGMGGHAGFLGRGLMTDAASALNLSAATLRADLAQGKTLAAIAVSEGSSATALETTLTNDLTTALAQAVSAGTITAAQEAAMESRLATLVDRVVTSTPPFGHGGWRGPLRTARASRLMRDAASALNLSVATVRQDLSGGKTLAALAVAQGSTAAALESTLEQDVKASLLKAEGAGRLTAAQVAAREARLSPWIDAFVTGSGWRTGGHGLGSANRAGAGSWRAVWAPAHHKTPSRVGSPTSAL